MGRGVAVFILFFEKMSELKINYNGGRKLFELNKHVGKDKNTWNQSKVNGKVSDKFMMTNCENTLITIESKLNQVMISNCKNCAVICTQNIVGAVDLNNCKKVTVQVQHDRPIINVAKDQDCVVYLNRESIDKINVISEASSGCNIKYPGASDDCDDVEFAIPEQISTTFKTEDNTINQICKAIVPSQES